MPSKLCWIIQPFQSKSGWWWEQDGVQVSIAAVCCPVLPLQGYTASQGFSCHGTRRGHKISSQTSWTKTDETSWLYPLWILLWLWLARLFLSSLLDVLLYKPFQMTHCWLFSVNQEITLRNSPIISTVYFSITPHFWNTFQQSRTRFINQISKDAIPSPNRLHRNKKYIHTHVYLHNAHTYTLVQFENELQD